MPATSTSRSRPRTAAKKPKPARKPRPPRAKKEAAAPAPQPIVEEVQPDLGNGFISVDAARLARWVKALAPAASTDEARPILCGINITVDENGSVTMAATDRYRLHVIDAQLHDTAAKPCSMIVPAGWLAQWARRRHQNSLVELSIKDGNRVTWSEGDENASIRAINGKYPNFRSLLEQPPAEEKTALNPKYLSAALRAAEVFGEGITPVRTKALNTLKPCLFTVDHAGDALSLLLMPVRVP